MGRYTKSIRLLSAFMFLMFIISSSFNSRIYAGGGDENAKVQLEVSQEGQEMPEFQEEQQISSEMSTTENGRNDWEKYDLENPLGTGIYWIFVPVSGELLINDNKVFSESIGLSDAPYNSLESQVQKVIFSKDRSLTLINDCAFYKFDGLTNIVIPSNITRLGRGAFSLCHELKNVEISPSIVSISESAFLDCINLTNVTIPNSVLFINDFAFCNCFNLKTVKIPDGVIFIGIFAFADCPNLTNIEIPSGITFISDGAFLGCRSLANIEIPNGVQRIGQGAFNNCALVNIIIPYRTTQIDQFAFWGCSDLTEIVIPSSVRFVAVNAFSDCPNIKRIICPRHLAFMIRSICDHDITIETIE